MPHSDYYLSWADALHLHRDNFYGLPDFCSKPAVAPMAIALKESAYPTITYKSFSCKAATAKKRDALLLSHCADISPVSSLRANSNSDVDSSSPTSSEEGAEFLFGWAESRKERRHANRELKKNTKLNNGMYKVKERLAIFREEEDCGFSFCFGEDSDEEGESEDEIDELVCESDESEEDEEVFDGDEGVESEDSDTLCGDDDEQDGSSIAQDGDFGDDEDDNEEKYAGSEKDEEGDSDDETDNGDEQVKSRKRKARKSVSWKHDDDLTEIHIVAREDLSMEYVFGQERAMMMKEDGTSKFASKKATNEKTAATTQPTTKQNMRDGSHRINSDDEADAYVFGQQSTRATKVDQQRSHSPQEEPMTSRQHHTVPKNTEAKAIDINQTTEEEGTFVFGGRQSKIRKTGPNKTDTTAITVTEIELEDVASEPEEVFVFGKQPGVWKK
ncbi:hypothetical protein BLS_002107 [Venturia inaequalis]|uniref:FHA domain-containing protein n=1 Tax=Venturia inaequalis TaxID=5025 RepID=A0A8H3VGX4_VENIN|nr:hypothetical protein BLS_002107 [Venturia inaequalis]KAE9986823.1 hypothetical protein EG328_004542 [Venturia inaequalis]RDI87956.1 hypothetical protein Vi05172_g1825 [Venturia inaequalis]